ncbi:MAG: hypothetical protein WBW48_10400 [Anaerolineae bacterium]
MNLSSNDLVGRWKVEFEDGKTGWLTLEPRDNYGQLPGRMFVAKAVVDYPPNQKRPGMDYNNNVFAIASDTFELGSDFGLYHECHPNPRSGEGTWVCSLVAEGVMVCKTITSEQGGDIMQYPGVGYPFQFMGSGNFTATK